MKLVASVLTILSFSVAALFGSEATLEKPRRILFLGDSITQAGAYVEYFDAWLVKKYPDRRYTVINAGVSSETVSGLSEEGHAGGRFPRPSVFERLERVLAASKPDLIIACYGMNCGIYLPLDKKRFERYKNGMLRLGAAARQHEAELVYVTPPIYDGRGKEGFDYDSVLTAYSQWLVSKREDAWKVADLHSEMKAKIEAARAKDPNFLVQKDRVHPNTAGHWMMAQSLISFFGDAESAKLATGSELLEQERFKALKKRNRAFQKAIHAETKPLRPGVPKGGTMESAQQLAEDLSSQIYP